MSKKRLEEKRLRKKQEKSDKALCDHYQKRYSELATSLAVAAKQKSQQNPKESADLGESGSSTEKRDSASKMLPKKRKRGIDHQADQEATAFVKTLNSKRGTKPSYEEVLRMLE